MKSIPHAFDSFLKSIELTPKQRKDANEQHTRLRTQLQKRMKVKDNFLSGSYARKTAIAPLGDIDVFLVLEPQPGFDVTVPVAAILGEIKRVLDELNAGKSALLQNRSVNIAFSGTGISYDVVPAFPTSSELCQVPDRETGKWVKSNPKRHAELAIEANRRTGQKLNPLVKAIKAANQHHRGLARSFHVEALSWKILEHDPGPYLDGLALLLAGLAKRICGPCADPATQGGDIRPEPERCEAARQWLERMAGLAAEAKALDDAKETGQAHARLKEIFGPRWVG